ncbi:histidine phosphatase family protein [Roseovarius aquimarinus]|uniref:Histidine phosphatase family protein n=1 Tax=Roseovarius aquimarinus TaxID=1229156 RepID=A0ABW7IAT4_9RHOB
MSSRDRPELPRRRFLALGAAALLLPSAALARPALREALRRGGHVIYFRHGATTWSGIDHIDWPRERQRLLSDLGIAQSERIGAAFRAANFPVGEVLASPFARCRDMAEIAFGRVEERRELLGLLSDDAGRAGRIAYLRDLLTTPPAEGTNRVIVAHRSNIEEVAGARLAEGEALVTRPAPQGFETLAQWMPEDWARA